MLAAAADQPPMVRSLLKYRASPHTTDKVGRNHTHQYLQVISLDGLILFLYGRCTYRNVLPNSKYTSMKFQTTRK